MACPARFERATYALEALKMRLNNTKNNGIKVLAIGVAYTPRTLVSGGLPWSRDGIVRWSDGLASNLSGKPTNLASIPERTSLNLQTHRISGQDSRG